MKVNGKDRAVPAEGTVLGLLNELGHDPQRVAVEKNGAIIPRAQFAEEKLTDADHLEVVCFVGGGGLLRLQASFQARGVVPHECGYDPENSARRRRHTEFSLVKKP